MELPSNRSEPLPGLLISAVERDTGLGKDTLRVWERRYGFPLPLRNEAGERVYPAEQVERLRLIRRLLDAGYRAGKVVPMERAELERLASFAVPLQPAPPPNPLDGSARRVRECLALLCRHDPAALRGLLARELSQLGVSAFIQQLIAPLNHEVGMAWVRGEIRIFEEHLYTEVAQGLLRQALALIPPPADDTATRVLLVTVPGEPHGLGLLMAEAFFALEGCRCTALGLQLPVADIADAAVAHRAEVVALGFSGCMAAGAVTASLAELRARLPAGIALWAGGSAPVLRRRPPPGVTVVLGLEEIAKALQAARPPAPPESAAQGPGP